MKMATTTQVCVELVCLNTQPLSISTSLQTSHCPMSRKRNKARQNCLWNRLAESAHARAISVTARENIKQGALLCTLSAICYLFVVTQRSFTNGNVFHWASSANPLEQRHAFRVSNKHKKFPKTVPISKSLLSYGNKITNSSLCFFWRRSRIALAVTEIASARAAQQWRSQPAP